jgi:hypothetical protein
MRRVRLPPAVAWALLMLLLMATVVQATTLALRRRSRSVSSHSWRTGVADEQARAPFSSLQALPYALAGACALQPLPLPSAALSALTVSSLPTDWWSGRFLQKKLKQQRRLRRRQSAAQDSTALVIASERDGGSDGGGERSGVDSAVAGYYFEADYKKWKAQWKWGKDCPSPVTHTHAAAELSADKWR